MMRIRNRLWRGVTRLLVALCVTGGAATSSAADQSIPASIYSCETAGCNENSPQYGHWSFEGNKGHASWPKFGLEAELTVERFTDHEVVIRRVDVGRTKGTSAVYRGTINGSRIEGTSEYTVPGQPTQTFPWSATIETPDSSARLQAWKPLITVPLPDTLHFCAAHCYTFILKGDHYEGIAGGAYTGKINVRKFTATEVELNRIDPPNQWFPKGLTATLSGKVTPQGDSIENGKLVWTFGQAGTYDMYLAWGRALKDLPGDDNFLPPLVLHFCAANCTTWYLTLDHKGFTKTPKTPALEARGYGMRIVRFRHDGVELERKDAPSPGFPQGLQAVVTGQVSDKSTGLVNGKIQWTSGQSGTFDAAMSWGTGLNDIQGDNGPAQVAVNQSGWSDLLMFFLATGSSSDSSSRSHHQCDNDIDCMGHGGHGRCVNEDWGENYTHTYCVQGP
jgi:hypothetical protein